jgi:hypothetical protein
VKLHYYAETDSLYIELSAAPGVETLDIDAASRTLDLTTLETIALPIMTTRAA